MKWLIPLLAFGFIYPCIAAPVSGSGKYIIAFGGLPASAGGTPTPQDMLSANNLIKTLPVDGLVINLTNVEGFFADTIFERPGPSSEKMQPDLEAYEALHRGRGADNHDFIRIDTSSLVADWYDDKAWKMIADNFYALGQAMAKIGVRGIMLDTEAYSGTPFNYKVQSHRTERSYAEYCAEVRLRGKQIMMAVTESMPDAITMITFGPSVSQQEKNPSFTIESSMGLIPAFTRGLEEGALSGKVIDAFETSYIYRSFNQFKEARAKITAPASNAFPGYDGKQSISVGFGLWLHKSKGAEGELDPDDFRNNTFSPEEWEYAMYFALSEADAYIWVYCVPWLNLPEAYRKTFSQTKKPHRLDFKPLERPEENKPVGYILTAKGRLDTPDAVVFAPFYRTHKELFDFPKVWKFSFDSKDVGQKVKWFKIDHDISDWQNLRIDDWWEPQVKHTYLGAGWYRVEFTPSYAWKGRRLLLCFGAADEDTTVYLNGKLLGTHIYGADGWNTPFEFLLEGKLLWDKPNILVVRVMSKSGVGGIWKSVKIFAPKK